MGRVVERHYDGTSLNIAIQDGVNAGQSVPHVHTHIIPRKQADLDSKGGSDAIYGMLEADEGNIGKHQHDFIRNRPKFPSVDHTTREPRSDTEMAQEATVLAKKMEAANGDACEKL